MLILPTKLGFTLIEALIVLSILSVFISLELPMGLSSYAHAMHRTDVQLITSSLRKARLDAINHVCANPNCTAPAAHGVFITPTQLTIFEGSSYASRYVPADILITLSTSESISGATSTEILFAAGTGDVKSNLSLVFVDPGQQADLVTINTEGMITP